MRTLILALVGTILAPHVSFGASFRWDVNLPGTAHHTAVHLQALQRNPAEAAPPLGSGLMFGTKRWMYLVTAKHVYEAGEGEPIVASVFPTGTDEEVPDIVTIKTDKIWLERTIFLSKSDLVAFRLGRTEGSSIKPVENVTISDPSHTRPSYRQWTLSSAETSKKFDDVRLTEDAVFLGFPNSLNAYLKSTEIVYDDATPLFRRAMIAGKNTKKKILILDGMAHHGNSGGPAFSISRPEVGHVKVDLIGIVGKRIPFSSQWVDEVGQVRMVELQNSGYTVVISADEVIDLVRSADLK